MIEKRNVKKPAINPLYRIMQAACFAQHSTGWQGINPLYRIMQADSRPPSGACGCSQQCINPLYRIMQEKQLVYHALFINVSIP
jgi:hypothetical protein